MDSVLVVVPIMATLLMGAISPGPSFIVVAKSSLEETQAKGVAIAFGIGIASALFGIAALAGLHVVFETVPWLYVLLKFFGGLYLMYLAYKIFKGAREPLPTLQAKGRRHSKKDTVKGIALGFVTQISNPKTAVVFASVFATFMTAKPDVSLYLVLIPLIFIFEFGWYAFVAILLSRPKPQQVYAQAKPGLDRMAATILGALGIKLMSDSL